MNIDIYMFAEGKTEKNVLEGTKRVFPDLSFKHPQPDVPAKSPSHKDEKQGKDQVNRRLVAILGPLIEKTDPIRCLILRDLDAHAGETSDSIVQSVEDALNRTMQRLRPSLPIARLQQHPDYENVCTMVLSCPDLRLALHIATHRWRAEFIKATIDDYVLSLAARPATASALITRKNWPVSADDVLRKVTTEIPALLSANGIPLQEAKDYVRFMRR